MNTITEQLLAAEFFTDLKERKRLIDEIELLCEKVYSETIDVCFWGYENFSVEKLESILKDLQEKTKTEKFLNVTLEKTELNTEENQSNYAALKEQVLSQFAQHRNDTGTELIVQQILSSNHIYTTRSDEKTELFIYHEGIYIPQGKSFVKEFVREILQEAFTTYRCNNVIAKIEADTFINSEDLFSLDNVEEIAVENGVLNIFTRELSQFTPNKFFFNKLPVKYDPNKDCPIIKKHLEEVLRFGEDIKVMQELFGFCLLREYRIEKAFMLIGTGRNGKSKTIELMKRFIGIENCVNIPLQQLEIDNFALSELHNKMANLAGDIDDTTLKKTGNFKTLTGRDLISASKKFLPRVKFTNYAKLIFLANKLPRVYDMSEGFWNRWILLEFPYSFFSEKELNERIEEENCKLADPDIIEKLTTEKELSGLLNWSLDGLERLLKQKDFSYSKSTAETKEAWIRKSDSFRAFLMDCIEEEYGHDIEKQVLKRSYAEYCKKHKIEMVSDKSIKYTLTTNFAVTDKQKWISFSEDADPYSKEKGKRIYIWEGIKFKENAW